LWPILDSTGMQIITITLAMLFAGPASTGQPDEPIGTPRVVPVLPQPRFEVMPPLQGTASQLPPTIATRQNRYESWQYVGISQTGQFRPRVLLFPDGEAFWAVDGTWYPWLTTHMTWVVPFFISL
jgi:hypothetical protein